MSLRALTIAAGSSLQDAGRRGYRKFGVPPGGAFDRESAFLANALLGNEAFAPVLEMPLMGGTFSCSCPTNVAVVGAVCEVKVETRAWWGSGRFSVGAEQVFAIGPVQSGVRSYLAIEGGFNAASILGSISGTTVKRGDSLTIRQSQPRPPARLAESPTSLLKRSLRFIAAGQSNQFDLDAFAKSEFKVAGSSDRRGVRLEGQFKGSAEEIASEPACVGAIQITPSGMPILLGVDGPTIGGYPKIGVIISADLSALGQLAPASEVTLQQVAAHEASQAWFDEEKRLGALATRLKIG